ncbi:MAG: ferredoxin family protein [Kiritimatiellae bacterium]|nr:ferredoxin family protein [Kiritimatiellia bacterium]
MDPRGEAAPATRAVVCRCVWSRRVEPSAADAVAAALAAAGWTVRTVDDLCEAAAVAASWWLEWLREPSPGVICACRPRAVRALMAHTLGGALPAVRCVDLVAADATEAVRRVGTASAVCAAPSRELRSAAEGWLPWFPVIDPARCTACGLCVEFCLFGVYELKEGRVRVARPANCRPRCPACSRICPEIAIVFPKYDEPPMDGSEVTDEASERARAVRERLEMLGGGELRDALEARRRRALAARATAERASGGRGSGPSA